MKSVRHEKSNCLRSVAPTNGKPQEAPVESCQLLDGISNRRCMAGLRVYAAFDATFHCYRQVEYEYSPPSSSTTGLWFAGVSTETLQERKQALMQLGHAFGYYC
jgi:hypothetical protein